ncbi:MAG: MoaD/ThiS family protein [Caloramator sp.]|nr:MoaD/ThiS family protein [Caloramator sp.]
MKITVKLFAMLSKYTDNSTFTVEIPEGSTVDDLIKKLALPVDEIFNCTINGQNADFNTRLKNGDTVGFYPYIGGG